MTTEPILDPATLDGLISIGGKSFACQMIDLFFSYVPQKLAEARAAEQAGDVVGIKNAVHPIKSSANNLGTVVVKRLATQIELLAIANDGAAIALLQNAGGGAVNLGSFAHMIRVDDFLTNVASYSAQSQAVISDTAAQISKNLDTLAADAADRRASSTSP